MSISVVIADDEAIARRRVARLLRARDEVNVVAQCAGGREAVQAIGEHHPDLVLLDVQMPDLDGFGVIEEVGADQMPQVIFVTAYDQHAIRAFDVNAVDYLIKPYPTSRFNEAIDRAVKRLSDSAAPSEEKRFESILQRVLGDEARVERNGNDEIGADRIIVKDRDRMRLVRAQDVEWIESEGNYVRLHVGSASHLVRGNLSRLEDKLAAYGFLRVHRRYLVNLDRVSEVQPWFGGDAVLVLGNGARVRLSRTFRESFEARFLSP